MRDLFKSLFLALTAGVLFGFTACVTDAGGKKEETGGEVVTNPVLQSVELEGSTSITATGTSTLTASPTFSTGTATPTYTWKIIQVNGATASTTQFATLTGNGKTATLTGNNTTTAAKTVTVQVTATYNGVSKTASLTVTIAAAQGTVTNELKTLTLVAESASIHRGENSILTAAATYSGTVSLTYNWAITAVDGTTVSSTEYASLSSTTGRDSRAVTTVKKYNTLTSANATATNHTVTVTLTASDGTVTKTATAVVTLIGDSITEISDTYYPLQGTTEAYADTYLELEFDSAPTVNRGSSKTVRIYKSDGTLVDTIATDGETMYGYGYGGNSGKGSINVQYQLIQVIGNKVRIIPHHNTSTGLTLLENSTSYYVLIDDGLITGNLEGSAFAGITETTGWTFTTAAAPSVSGNTITVGDGGNFITVQGAFSWMMANSKKGDWTIKIEPGTYYERIFYSGSANITMSGQGSAEYGTDVEIQWCNQDGGDPTKVTNTLWNYGSRGRNVFFFHGGDLILENLSIINTATRKSNEYGEYDSTVTSDNANGNNQAEALLFDSTGNCAAYNCNFKSKQDTIYLSPSGGKAWFYGCKIAGDVDFIWGLSDVALFEQCNIISAYDSDKSSNHETYIVAPHLATGTAPYGKGFVLYNCDVTTESGQKTYLARSPWGSDGTISQVAIIDTAVTGGLESNPWYKEHVGGDDETVLGWKWYGVTSDGSAISAANKLSQAQYEAEFAGRNNIINRTYDGSAFSKASSTWDVNTLAQTMGWNVVTDNSKATLDGEDEITSIIWKTSNAALSQTRNQTFYMYTDLSTTTTAPTGAALYNYLYCDGSANDYIQNSLELYGTAAIYVPVTTSSTATITFTKGAGTLTIAGTDYTASGSATVDCSSATLVTLNGINYVEVRVKGTAGGTSDKWYITNVTVVTTGSSGGSGGENSSSNKISLSDTPSGYAGADYSDSLSYTTVSPATASQLKTYLKSSTAYIIRLSGVYDLSEGYLPSTAGGSTALLDALVKKVSVTDDSSAAYEDYETYAEWKAGYGLECTTSTDDKSSDNTKLVWALNSAYQKIVKVNLGSNKIIIGDGTAVIKGGLLNISSKSNIIIRNVTIQDAYDPFPHHESGDGFNAELDCICIQGTSSYIWIDHCTLQDTLGYSYVTISDGKTKEKWQTFDGLCDIKNSVSNITVSYCKIAGHDKTMLIGNNDSDGNSSTRTITLHHNYFYNCGQRLPMVRNSTIHIYNNYYYHKDSSATYSQQYAVGVRAGAVIYAENNYFSSGIKYSFKDSYGTLYSNGNEDNSEKGCDSTVTGTALFSSALNAYSYDVDPAADVPDIVAANAGAGAWEVEK